MVWFGFGGLFFGCLLFGFGFFFPVCFLEALWIQILDSICKGEKFSKKKLWPNLIKAVK